VYASLRFPLAMYIHIYIYLSFSLIWLCFQQAAATLHLFYSTDLGLLLAPLCYMYMCMRAQNLSFPFLGQDNSEAQLSLQRYSVESGSSLTFHRNFPEITSQLDFLSLLVLLLSLSQQSPLCQEHFLDKLLAQESSSQICF
jgi:hypothetical protein